MSFWLLWLSHSFTMKATQWKCRWNYVHCYQRHGNIWPRGWPKYEFLLLKDWWCERLRAARWPHLLWILRTLVKMNHIFDPMYPLHNIKYMRCQVLGDSLWVQKYNYGLYIVDFFIVWDFNPNGHPSTQGFRRKLFKASWNMDLWWSSCMMIIA